MEDLSILHHPVTQVFETDGQLDSKYLLSEDQRTQFKEAGYISGIKVLGDHQIELLRTELLQLTGEKSSHNPLWYEYHSNESTDPSSILMHALGAWRIAPHHHDILWHRPILVPASQLLGLQVEGVASPLIEGATCCGPILTSNSSNGSDGSSDYSNSSRNRNALNHPVSVRFWHDQLFCKPSRHGGVVAWHQDYSYWTRTTPMAHLTCWIGLDDTDEHNGCLQYIPGSHKWDLLPVTGIIVSEKR